MGGMEPPGERLFMPRPGASFGLRRDAHAGCRGGNGRNPSHERSPFQPQEAGGPNPVEDVSRPGILRPLAAWLRLHGGRSTACRFRASRF